MKIFIVHGYTAGVNSHWFPWLTEQFSQKNHTVTIVKLPNSQTPVREDWLDTLSSTINVPDDETIIVTHSLGGYTTLRYLTDLTQDWSLAGLILVSGFLGKLAAIPELDTFLSQDCDITPLIPHIATTSMLHSDNDPWVPPQASIDLGEKLHAHIIEVPGAGHFLDREYTLITTTLNQTLAVDKTPLKARKII